MPTAMSQTSLASKFALSSVPFEPYRELSDRELEARISSVKKELGDSLLILGHHYQQDEVIRFADLLGDSFKLSQLAAASRACRAIVFCGVHFMAETADVLSRDHVQVYLPDMAAGCSMADMADLESLR
jgi:quinolinate synthase